jgi:hypothetical protein
VHRSSVPPGSQAPWFRPGEAKDDEDDDDTPLAPNDKAANDNADTQTTDDEADKTSKASKAAKTECQAPRNPGKQPGAQGFGRTQILLLSGTEHHYAEACAGAGTRLPMMP